MEQVTPAADAAVGAFLLRARPLRRRPTGAPGGPGARPADSARSRPDPQPPDRPGVSRAGLAPARPPPPPAVRVDAASSSEEEGLSLQRMAQGLPVGGRRAGAHPRRGAGVDPFRRPAER